MFHVSPDSEMRVFLKWTGMSFVIGKERIHLQIGCINVLRVSKNTYSKQWICTFLTRLSDFYSSADLVFTIVGHERITYEIWLLSKKFFWILI